MAQESPSRILYAQAVQMIKKLQQRYSTTKNQTPQETSESINDLLSKFSNDAGTSLTKYEPVVISEVPRSEKMNRFWGNLQDDINILQDQVDILNAASVFSHNFIKTEILKAQRENNRLHNKIKTLEMYSSVDNASLLYFGDNFLTEDFIDWNLVSSQERATLIGSGHIGLRVTSQQNTITSKTTVSILSGSNGFMGNNQEIVDPQQAEVNPSNGQKIYTFTSEVNRAANPKAIIDSQPNTWFEFEKCWIAKAARAKAKDLNFQYMLTNSQETKYLTEGKYDQGTVSGIPVEWADGIEDAVLHLVLEVDLGENQQVNTFNLLPFGLSDNSNNPIKIVKVSTSLNRTDWSVISPENVWISNGINKQISNINTENVLVGSATWVTDGSTIRYIRFEIEQPNPVDSNIGHIYYVSKDGPAVNTPNYNIDYPNYDLPDILYDSNIPYDFDGTYGGVAATAATDQSTGYANGALSQAQDNTSGITDDLNYRLAGPNPPVTNPQLYMDLRNSIVNGLIQKREFFKGKRWVIGIRDIDIKRNVYDTTGIVVSNRFNVPGIVDRVSLEADIFVPDGYDTSSVWIKFYVSPDDGLTWYQISRIQDDFLDIPEIIAFNDPTPNELREPGVAYYDVKGTVDSLRVKIEIARPSDTQSSTPIVRSYKLKVIRRD